MESKGNTTASVDLLYDGMVTPHNIYSSGGDVLLLRQGRTMLSSQIDAIKRMNAGQNIIRVSFETRKMLLEHNLSCKLVSQTEQESESGYSDVIDETLTLLEDIAEENTISHESLHTASEELSDWIESTSPDRILDLVNAIAPADEYLQRHCTDVSLLNGLIGKWLEFPKEDIETLVLAGLVHDTGKALIPSEILNAPRKLAVAEFEVMKTHPVFGFDLLPAFSAAVRNGAQGHHEKQNGKGYPYGVSGDDIPLVARITAVSDIYDAMVSRRSYKNPNNPFHILSLFKTHYITELDPHIVELFISNMPNELLNKPVLLSDGEIGAIHAIDPDDIEYPYVRVHGQEIKTSNQLHCVYMYFEE